MCAVLATILSCCSSVKHVPQGQYLLDNVEIDVNGDRTIKSADLINFLRQQPNHKVLGFARIQLATYSLSGRDSTKWYNKWLRRLGQAPVIYDTEMTNASCRQLRQALINKGYMDATVTVDTTFNDKRRRADVVFHVNTGAPHYVNTFRYNIADPAVDSIVRADSTIVDIVPGMAFDRNRLDQVRTTITSHLRDKGYYAFKRENITFTADTLRGSKMIGLTLNIANPTPAATTPHRIYVIRNVTFITEEARNAEAVDTVEYRGMSYVYASDDHYIKPSALYDMCFIEPGDIYSSAAVDRTYSSLSRLSILRFISIEMEPVGAVGDTEFLDATIAISRNRKQSIALELEGTNSEGDLGFGVGATYQNRNLTHRSDMLTVKFRASYESLSGKVEGLINNRYTEYAGEVGITFPKFELPFASRSFKKRMQATTEVALSFNYQERPEYTRIIAGAAWRWKWNNRRGDYNRRYTFDLVDVNLVRLPRSTINFIEEIAPDNPLLKYSYEDHFIMRMGLQYYRTNRRIPTADVNAFAMQPHVNTLRLSLETAGNVLYGLSHIFSGSKDGDAYKVFGVQYSQYVKGEFTYTYTRNFNSRNALAFRVDAGIAYPYGNSSMVPFEKRFYAGGANGVRGWGVRTLGPGCYDAHNSVTDFINQCGDISMILSMEYRAKLFWVFEGALFIDAGNVWTMHNYPNQPGGKFKFNDFYKQIAASYGLGLRMDFTYFLLRFDLGFKAHNPAMNQEPWPLLHPKWGRDATFHFAVGYPF